MKKRAALSSLVLLCAGQCLAAGVTLTSSANPVTFGQTVTLTATVTPASATGTVTFFDGVSILEVEPLATGVAQFPTALLASGVHALVAYYGGDLNNPAAASPPLSQTVNPIAAAGFGVPAIYAVGATNQAVAVGDFNADGNADLAIAGDGFLSVLLSSGGGTFQPAVNYGTANSIEQQALAVGDFNGDGRPDLAVGANDGGIAIFLGNGDGTFQSQIEYPAGTGAVAPSTIVVADVNGDGRADLIAIGPNGVVSVYTGNGDGTFAAAATFSPLAPSPPPNLATASLGVGDFNGDGKPDLVVICGFSAIGIVLGNGDGTFQSTPVYSTGIAGAAYPFAVADINGDGKADLVIPSLDGGATVFLGNGDGTLQGQVDYGDSANASSAAVVADFNGDGNLDIALAQLSSSFAAIVSVLPGNGDGNFGPPSVYAAGNYPDVPFDLAAGDFNGDGRADLVLTNAFANNVSVLTAAAAAQTTTVLSSSENPSTIGANVTFTATVTPAAAGGTVTFLDGSTTIGTSPLFFGRSILTLSTLPFGSHALTAVYGGDAGDLGSTSPVLTQVVDLDATATFLSSSLNPANAGQSVTLRATVTPPSATGSVTFMDGSATLGTIALTGGAATLTTSTLAAGPHVLTGVYGGDSTNAGSTSAGLTETIYTSRSATVVGLTAAPNPSVYGQNVTLTATVSPASATGTVTFYDGIKILATGPLVSGQTRTQTLPDSGTRSIVAFYGGDANNSAGASGALAQTVNAAAGGGFAPASNFGAGTFPQSIAVGDFNGDGRGDLAIAGNGSLSVLIGNGDGTFRAPVAYFASDIIYDQSIATGDFNGDGKTDLVVGEGGAVGVFLGNGDGTFQPAAQYATSGAEAITVTVAVADLNGDGKADIVALGQDALVSVLLGNGDGTFGPAVHYGVSNFNSTPPALGIGDFNGDGVPDLAITGNALLILLGNGDGTFPAAPASTIPVTNNPASFVVADLNGDGKTDLAIPIPGGGLTVLLGNGDGTFQQPANYSGLTNSLSAVTGDFNGDGKPDIAVSSVNGGNGGGSAAILFGNGDGTFQSPVSYAAGLSSFSLAAGEFNGDGRTDLAVTNYGGGNVSILLGTAPCVTVTPPSLAADSTGGLPQTLTVTAAPSCSWNATSSAGWIQLSPASGNGGAPVTVTLAPNSSGTDRAGSITIGGVKVPVTEPFTQQVFADVLPSAFYFDAVNLLSTHSITNGCAPDDFCPTQQIIREQMAVFLVRAVYNGSDTFPYSQVPWFADVPADNFFFKWIQRMYELGITSGCGTAPPGSSAPLLFCPSDTVTRAEMAPFIIRMRYGTNTVITPAPAQYFTDVPPSAQFYSYIERMKEDNITSGCTPATYCPDDAVTRGDMAIFVMRGAFNQLLPAGQAAIASVSPATLAVGGSGTYTVTGVNTNFVQGTTAVVAVDNGAVTASNITVTGPSTLTVTFTADAGAAAQPVSIYVQTGTEEAVLPNGLTVQ